MPKKKKKVEPEFRDTTMITLNVPNGIYDEIKTRATASTRQQGFKKSIHDEMIEVLNKGVNAK